jgi:Glyoxalase-like domain
MPSAMRLRQVALVARELEPVVSDLCAVFGLEVAFNDPGVAEFGLRNAVMPVGNTFLEVVSPAQPNTTASRFLDRRGGDGGYMVILQTDALDAERKRIDAIGLRVVWSIELPDARTIHLHPRDIGGAIVSLDQMAVWDSWRWAGPRWQQCVRTSVTSAIDGVELQSGDPNALARRWAQVLDRTVTWDANGRSQIAFDGEVVRFVRATDGRGDGVSGVDVAVADSGRLLTAARARGLPARDDQVVIGGTRFYLRAPKS